MKHGRIKSGRIMIVKLQRWRIISTYIYIKTEIKFYKISDKKTIS